jgi:hypothetical protein
MPFWTSAGFMFADRWTGLLLVTKANFQVIELRISELLAELMKGMLNLLLQPLWIITAIAGTCGSHGDA